MRLSAIAAATVLLVSAGVVMADTRVATTFAQLFRDKGWVTAYAGSRDQTSAVVAIDLIVARQGSAERSIYAATSDDRGLGEPVVSRDGSFVAFRKEQRKGATVTQRIFVASSHGEGLRSAVLLVARGIPIKGALFGTSAAWSHDNRKLVFNHNVDGQEWQRDYADALNVVDVASGAVQQVVAAHRRRPGSSLITPHAWAPDGRRIVYTDAQGVVTVLDTLSGATESLGLAELPTWSADGAMIAAMVRQNGKGYDYVVISMETKQRRTVLSSRRGFFNSDVFFGKPLWTPDGRFLIIPKLEGEHARTHVLDWQKGEVEPVPFRFRGNSIGGRS